MAAAAALTLLAVLLYANLTTPDRTVEHAIAHRYDTRDPQFARTMSHLAGHPVVPGNRVTALQNGDQAFPAMLEAIRSAKRSITLEAYIFWPGTIGTDLRRGARGAGARRGGDPPDPRRSGLPEAGRGADRGHAPGRRPGRRSSARSGGTTSTASTIAPTGSSWWWTGRVGFTGGLGIADLYLGHAQDRDHWRDSQFRAEGPVVGQLQAAFLDNWIESGGALLHGTDYFPPLDSARRRVGPGGLTARPAEAPRTCGSCTISPSPRPRRSILIAQPVLRPQHPRRRRCWWTPGDAA